MKKLILSIIIMALLAITSSCTPYADKFLYDPSQETPELKAKYDQMLKDAEPLVITELKYGKWLGKNSEYKAAYGVIMEDRIATYLLSNGQEITFRASQFPESCLLGTDSIIKVVLDDKGKVVRIVRSYFETRRTRAQENKK